MLTMNKLPWWPWLSRPWGRRGPSVAGIYEPEHTFSKFHGAQIRINQLGSTQIPAQDGHAVQRSLLLSMWTAFFPGDTEAHFPTLRKSPEEIGKTGQSFTGALASAPRLSGGVQGAHGASENLQAHRWVCVKSMPLTSVTSSKGTPKRSCSSRGSFCWVWWLSSATSYEKFLFEYIVIHF